jgi:hypothetical protein
MNPGPGSIQSDATRYGTVGPAAASVVTVSVPPGSASGGTAAAVAGSDSVRNTVAVAVTGR